MFRKKQPDLGRCLIPEGTFLMGRDGDSFDEGPAHELYLSAFEMAKRPVSNRDYALFVKSTRHEPPAYWKEPTLSHVDRPVVGVSWRDAVTYCAWLTQRNDLSFRLPSEAEFEKAARAGARGHRYPWGNDRDSSGYPIHVGPLDSPYPSGTNPANAYGLFDMVSNVYQWCIDDYDPEYYQRSPNRNPICLDGSEQKVARGHSWTEQDLLAPCCRRAHLSPYFKCNDFGFRWVVTF